MDIASGSDRNPHWNGKPLSIHVIALDLEGTLISNAHSQIPRPGLRRFLESCKELVGRVVMFTTVDEPRFRLIASQLVEERHAPHWFAEIEYVARDCETKNLALSRSWYIGGRDTAGFRPANSIQQ